MLKVRKEAIKEIEGQRFDAWMQEQIAICRTVYPNSCEGWSDQQLAERIEALFKSAQNVGIVNPDNAQRFVNIAMQLNNDGFHNTEEWAKTVFSWDESEEYKLAVCERHLAGAV